MANRTERKMVALRVKGSDYEYLQRVLSLAGMSMTGVMSDYVTSLAYMFRQVIGEEVDPENADREYYLRNMVRFSLLEMGKALEFDSSVSGRLVEMSDEER